MKTSRGILQICIISLLVQMPVMVSCTSDGDNSAIRYAIDYESFLNQHDMTWDRIPDRWEVAPYTGNGNVGFLFYQLESEGRNTLSIFAGRHDYYDHRLPHEGHENIWIYRGRLPLGHFNLESEGEIKSVDLRLSLWNAELTGQVKTTKGAYSVHGLTHSQSDIIYFETGAGEGESVKIIWQSEEPYSSVRASLDAGGGPQGETWDLMRNAPYPMPPAPTFSEKDGMQFCLQSLYADRGETTTAWEITGESTGRQILTASIHHSFPEHNSLETARQNLLKARKMLKDKSFLPTHRNWWHEYYPQSFLTINDPEKEAFYWIQMYKFASATRGDGPILDLMGPWYHKTFWPMVWGDLNVELIYWTQLTSNRLETGESLVNNIDKYAANLRKNVPVEWENSMALGALFPQDLVSDNDRKVPDMLAWICNNYWLHCSYAGDRERMRDKLFPVLKETVNSYLNYLKENPVDEGDGKIHIKYSWSPEYKPGWGQDINFTLALMRWSCRTLLDINQEHRLNDPLAPGWQNILDHLVGYQIDENGLRIGKDIPFDKPHRHYSHLLGFYPLAVITPENPEDRQLLRTSLDHWLDVSFYGNNTSGAMAVTGYTATGAASMYAHLGDGEKAYQYLDYFIRHKNVSPTTMYAEGNPVIESPLSYATCIHDMLLQSWGGKIRVFPGTPDKWADVAFHHLRTQGAFLVSAKKKQGITQFVEIESLAGSPCMIQTDIPGPRFYMKGEEITGKKIIRKIDQDFYQIDLKKGESVTITEVAMDQVDRQIEPIPSGEADRNLFGLNEKTTRLPGHRFYYKKD